MANKQRYQNPVIGDDLTLKLFTYNANARTNFTFIQKIEIFYLDPTFKTIENPSGLRLVQTIDGSGLNPTETGLYEISISLTDPLYVIGN